MPKKILVIEDELDIQNILKAFLEDTGYHVVTADGGLDGIQTFRQGSYDMVLLDIMMPKIDGYAVCEMIREDSNVPIIMITAMDEEADEVRGFELQVDDYITKPFSMPIVIKRIEAVLRRKFEEDGQNLDVLIHGDIRLSPVSRTIYCGEEPIALTTREFDMLKLFMENKKRVFTRDNLLNALWDYNFYGAEKIIDTHIKNIRKKLGRDCIVTIRGVGYRIGEKNKKQFNT